MAVYTIIFGKRELVGREASAVELCVQLCVQLCLELCVYLRLQLCT